MNRKSFLCFAALGLALGAPAFGADVTGKWTGSVETQVGVQNYTYDFKVDGDKLTGTAESQFGKSEIAEGSVKGDDISFVENRTVQDQKLRIEYKGKISGDEIKFTRKVLDSSADFVAKRAK